MHRVNYWLPVAAHSIRPLVLGVMARFPKLLLPFSKDTTDLVLGPTRDCTCQVYGAWDGLCLWAVTGQMLLHLVPLCRPNPHCGVCTQSFLRAAVSGESEGRQLKLRQ